ncbi:hypothetical protein ACFZCL_40200 [Streptomyces sp. NPDC008159]|uniref:hypothetical protein n=1 Tax=Streptomyces sp. NPDC008159 TaxID=3364817 RepID=UPI0036E711FD
MIGHTVRPDADFGIAVTAVRKALADHGFGVLTETDVDATLKAPRSLPERAPSGVPLVAVE